MHVHPFWFYPFNPAGPVAGVLTESPLSVSGKQREFPGSAAGQQHALKIPLRVGRHSKLIVPKVSGRVFNCGDYLVNQICSLILVAKLDRLSECRDDKH